MPSTVESNHSDDENGAASSNRKRVFDILLDSLTQMGRKKKHKKADIVMPYLHAGHWIPRAFSPFLNVTSIFWVGMSEASNHDGDQVAQAENSFIAQFTFKKREHLGKVYDSVLDLVSGFRDQMINFATDPEALDNIVDIMTDAAKGTCSDDTGGLKMKAVLYMPVNPRQDVCIPPITNEKSKSDRGFNHPMTSHLLCPQKLLTEYDADPSALRAKFLDGATKVVADDWPAFLYDEKLYDPDEIDKGLLRGYFLLRVYQHIFTSPSSALKDTPGSNATRFGNAKLHGMTKVTPATVTYAAVQARFFLSTAEVWGLEDGNFNLETFHSTIIELFEVDPSDPSDNEWATETLAWWNMAMFGVRAVHSESPAGIQLEDISNTGHLNNRALLLAQRARRRARCTQPATALSQPAGTAS